MKQYLDAVRTILDTGTRKENRTGVDTLSTFGVHYNVDLQEGFPLLTTKAISWKNIVVEMLWFLSGKTDVEILQRHNCKFWDVWTDENGQVPSAYGHFWRQFPVHGYLPRRGLGDQPVPHYAEALAFNDQIRFIVDTLKRDPMSRRMVVSAWAPENAQTSKLPPCHCMFVVNVQNDPEKSFRLPEMNDVEKEAMREMAEMAKQIDFSEPPSALLGDLEMTRRGSQIVANQAAHRIRRRQRLCLHLTQRSCDIALGVPYNIASYALLMHLFSRFSGIPVGTFSHTLVDAHAYTSKPDGSKAEYDHVPGLREQLTREPRPLPVLRISDSIQRLEDVEALMVSASTEEVMSHFVLEGYDPHPAIPFKVAV